MAAFDRAIALTLGIEGGESNNPLDHGGHTYRGVTQWLYDRWRAKHGLPQQDVTKTNDAEIRELAMEEFWLPAKCGDLPDDLAVAVFDMAFHSSPQDARVALQEALGFKGDAVDGRIGPVTIAAAHKAPDDIVLRFLKARAKEMRDIWIHDPSQLAFAWGWMNRILDQAWKGGKP